MTIAFARASLPRRGTLSSSWKMHGHRGHNILQSNEPTWRTIDHAALYCRQCRTSCAQAALFSDSGYCSLLAFAVPCWTYMSSVAPLQGCKRASQPCEAGPAQFLHIMKQWGNVAASLELHKPELGSQALLDQAEVRQANATSGSSKNLCTNGIAPASFRMLCCPGKVEED